MGTTLTAVRVISRISEQGVDVYDAMLELVHTFPAERVESHSVAYARDRLVYASEDLVTCLDTSGQELWSIQLDPGEGPARSALQFSGDDRHVWLYLPNVLTGRGGTDRWLVLDADTGAETARHDLPTSGSGGSHHCLGDGRMLLDVGEGQHGTWCFTATPDGPLVRLDDLVNRVPIDVSPDHALLMTVDHEQEDVAFHDVSDFQATVTVPLSAFGDWEFGEAGVEWTGGFLSAETAIVVVSGEDEETGQMWWKHFTVETATGQVIGEMGISTIDEYDLTPLGDVTYVITDTDGTLRRM